MALIGTTAKTGGADSDKALREPFRGVRVRIGSLQTSRPKEDSRKMKPEAGPVRNRSEEQLAFRTVPDMDLYAFPYSRIVCP